VRSAGQNGTVPSNPPTSALRRQVEGVSRPILVRLSALPRPVVLIGTLGLVVIGMLAPLPVALVALAIVFLFVAWIGYLSWPVVGTGGRFARIAMLALVLVLAWLRV
jgi:hypothetical protein